jgi:hypothetical protein
MKSFLILSLALIQLTACGVSSSSSPAPAVTEPTDAQQTPDPTTDGSTPTTPVDTTPKSPFKTDIAQLKDGVQTMKYTYVEALNRVDGKVELRFFTIAPRGMCNVSTLTDSSFYQTKFSYLKVRVNKAAGKVVLANMNAAEVGSRGTDFPVYSNQVTGEIFLSSIEGNEYTGWVDLNIPQAKIQGNFKIVNCNKTEEKLKNLNLLDLRYKTVSVRNLSGTEYQIQINSSYTKSNYSTPYDGYVNEDASISFRIMATVNAPRDLDNSFAGNPAGNFIAAGNMGCVKGSSGPAVAEIVGNTLYFNQGVNNRPHFCKYDGTELHDSGTIEFIPATGLRKITINHRNGDFVGTF